MCGAEWHNTSFFFSKCIKVIEAAQSSSVYLYIYIHRRRYCSDEPPSTRRLRSPKVRRHKRRRIVDTSEPHTQLYCWLLEKLPSDNHAALYSEPRPLEAERSSGVTSRNEPIDSRMQSSCSSLPSLGLLRAKTQHSVNSIGAIVRFH